ncbi:MAG: hypothetical protein LBJ73_02210 [Rickettsiales bacterium]|jgi:hypothetical protein|nr:hypothetical protein [Rickettsiales bacterium]
MKKTFHIFPAIAVLFSIAPSLADVASVKFIHDSILQKHNLTVPIDAANPQNVADVHYLYSVVDRANFLLNGITTNYSSVPNTHIAGTTKAIDAITNQIFTAYSYVQDGLVANFDGVYNTAAGHNAAAATWENLAAPSQSISIVGSLTWNANNLEFTGNVNNYATLPGTLSFDVPNVTVELVISYPAMPNMYRVILQEKSGRVVIGLYNNNTMIVTGDIETTNSKVVQLPDRAQGGNPNTHTVRYPTNALNYDYMLNATPVSERDGTNFWYANLQENSIIGRRITTKTTNQAPFVGKIYAIRIYNRLLSDAEITYNSNVDRARFGIE